MIALFCKRSFICCRYDSFIINYFLADVRCFVCRVQNDGFYFGILFYYFVIYIIKSYAVMNIAGSYFYAYYITVFLAGCMRFIRELSFVLTFYEQSAFRVSVSSLRCCFSFADSSI